MYYGSLALVSADNLGSLLLGDFKKAVLLTGYAIIAWPQRKILKSM